MAHPDPSQLGAWLARQLVEPGPLALAGLEAVGGGCIHRAWRLELADGRPTDICSVIGLHEE